MEDFEQTEFSMFKCFSPITVSYIIQMKYKTYNKLSQWTKITHEHILFFNNEVAHRGYFLQKYSYQIACS